MGRDKNIISFSIKQNITNFKDAMKILLIGTDKLGWNAYEISGITYIISIPFLAMGLIRSIKNRQNLDIVFTIWFVAAFILLPFINESNINRINIIIIPIVYYIILGLDFITNSSEMLNVILEIIYLALFINFQVEYYNTDLTIYGVFNNKLENTIQYVNNLDVDKIHFDYSFKEPYIYVLFYTKYNPHEFNDTVNRNENASFENIKSFGKYEFYKIQEIKNNEEKEAYVIPKEKEIKLTIDENIWDKVYIDDFVILQEKN